jgi:excisionase family DNA binding protein
MLTLAEAAARLGLSPSTLRHQAQAGRLRATLVGKTYVVSVREVERYRDEHQGRMGRPRK